MNKAEISYLTHTWNPLAMRCSPVSPACDHCWHIRMAKRLAANPKIARRVRAAYAGETWPKLVKSRLDEPWQRKKPAIIGVQLMGDLWYDAVFHRDILAVFSAALAAPWHTYIFLTKRSERMLEIISRYCEYKKWRQLPDNWYGMVTVENQEWADKRVGDLLEAPWARRGISAEPLLGTIDLSIALEHCQCGHHVQMHRLVTAHGNSGCMFDACRCQVFTPLLDIAIIGGETGPGARPMKTEWARDLRDQCLAASTKFHFKQWGEWLPESQGAHWDGLPEDDESSRLHCWHDENTFSVRVGNKRAGHLLDGVAHRDMPEVAK